MITAVLAGCVEIESWVVVICWVWYAVVTKAIVAVSVALGRVCVCCGKVLVTICVLVPPGKVEVKIKTVVAVSVALGRVWVSLGNVEVRESVREYVETIVLAGNVISWKEVSMRVEVPASKDVVTVYGYDEVIVDAGTNEVVVTRRTVVCVSAGNVEVICGSVMGRVEVKETVSE